MSTSLSPVSAVIPTYNGRRLLAKHLPAVFACLSNGDELVIVEDAGPDDTVPWTTKQFRLRAARAPIAGVNVSRGNYTSGRKKIAVTLVVNQQNQRFGETSNRGVKVAKHPLIFLINSDVAPRKTALKYLVPYFKDQTVFAVGLLENEHGKKSGKNKLWFERGMFIHAKADNFKAGPTAWVSGGRGLVG